MLNHAHLPVRATRTVRPEIQLWRLYSGELLAGTALRCLLLLLGSIAWRGEPTNSLALGAGLLVAALTLIAPAFWPLPSWATLPADALALGLLIVASGGAASPFLALTLALVALGALVGGGRDALVGGGLGVLALLLVGLVGQEGRGELLVGMAMAEVVAAALVTWSLGPGRGLLAGVISAPLEQPCDDALRALEWQRLNLAAVQACDTPEELRRRMAERAMTIAAAPVTVDLGDGHYTGPGGSSGYALTIPVAGAPGRLIVHTSGGAPGQPQREALEHLAALAALRAGELRAAEKIQRQQEAMLALWETAGIARLAPGFDDTLRDACRRLARALDLEWLAVVGPSERQMIAPLIIVPGRDGEPPRMQGAQLRVAAEAMRAGRPLIRSEGDATLACLPMRLGDETPLALAALGDTSEAGTQALLMVFGDMVTAGLAANTARA
jgi:hypothetical protein